MSIMPRFEHYQPQSLEEALDLLSRFRTSVKVIAGGTDLVPRMRAGVVEAQQVVSLNRVAGLNRINYTDEDGLIIGATARLADVGAHPDVRANYPGLAHACSVMATTQIRNMGTVAGNLANAAPSADTAAPLLAYGASVVLVERGGRRQVDLTEFFTGPGMTVAEPMEIVEAIRVPAPPLRTGSCYQRISARGQVDIAAVGVAAALNLDMGGRIIGCRLALGAVAPTPVRALEAEQMLIDQLPEPEILARAGAACVRTARPIDDVRASASYRRLMVQVLSQRALAEAAQRARGEM
jgi:carbon-monoxide dehydrogenase medium subunit